MDALPINAVNVNKQAIHLQALPPFAQRNREIQAILADPRLYETLGSSEMIQSIEKTEEGYLIKTYHYALEVTVVYETEKRIIGPVPFHLEFSDLKALF